MLHLLLAVIYLSFISLGLPDALLGLFDGLSLVERAEGGYDDDIPDVITIFKGPHERCFGDRDEMVAEIGKTIIHPNQIQPVNDGYKVTEKNYKDALSIINWNSKEDSYVSGNRDGERMNEYKTHLNWARKTCFLAEAFGVIPQTV